MVIGSICNEVHIFYRRNAPLIAVNHATQLSEQFVIATYKLGITKITCMLPVIIMYLIEDKIPIDSDSEIARGETA